MKVALIGYGYWGKIIEKYLTQDDEIELVYVYDIAESSHPLYINSYDPILTDESVGEVFICTPINTHFVLCQQALAHGKNVFCEKPTVRNIEELDILIKLAQKNKCILYTDYLYTVSPTINFIKDNISSIGKLLSITGRIEQFTTLYPEDSVYEVLGVHLMSAIYYITKKKAYNVVNRDLFGINNIMTGSTAYVIEDNINVEIYCSMAGESKERKLQFIGELGKIEFSLNTSPTCMIKRWIIKDGRLEIISDEIYDFNENDGLANSINQFKCYVKNNKLESNLDIAVEVTRILEKHLRKAKEVK